MKIFLDTANIQEISDAEQLGVLDGVTTNPSLMAKEGINYPNQHYALIADIVDGPVSAEVISTDYKGMIKEAVELSAIRDNIVVKLPCTEDGIKATKYCSVHNIKTNVTLVFSAMQALLAAKAGATYVSPFIGRLDDISFDGMQLIKDIRQIFDKSMFLNTQILGASTRHPIHILECAKLGCDVVTLPYSVIKKLFKHPLTDSGLEQFLKDHESIS
tara:strand:- start:1928 stop:2575 length:648 start_codon:yes stop_codon:yes gene_type:complete